MRCFTVEDRKAKIVLLRHSSDAYIGVRMCVCALSGQSSAFFQGDRSEQYTPSDIEGAPKGISRGAEGDCCLPDAMYKIDVFHQHVLVEHAESRCEYVRRVGEEEVDCSSWCFCEICEAWLMFEGKKGG